MKIRTIALFLAFATLALTGTACVGGGQSTDPDTTPDTDATTNPEDTAADTAADTTPEDTATDTAADTTPEDTTADDEGDVTTPVEDDNALAAPQVIEFDPTVTITESGTTAKVTANGDLAYTATGHKSVSGDRFVINRDFTVTFDPSATTAADFNRFSICYVSDQPIKGTVTYTEGGTEKTDYFFMEAGERTFSCLTTNYLKGTKGKNITSMTFTTCNGEAARFALCLLRTYDYPIYKSGSDDTYYISNDRFRLGIRLSWGGGINYLRDKQARGIMDEVTNLINQYDTGRLVQQSYYGTYGEGDYEAGEFNNSKWCYNPVQGGDKYQNHSRIIDVVVKEHSVYIKSQPQDWSLNNRITPSYMENTYILYEDRVQVDNRFVDFSNMTHRYAHQELPAFYTLSCFDKFTWYGGSNGWTGDALSSRDDLNFWGDPAYSADCQFPMRKSNTETWCAWTNSEKNYGIGLYVPNVDLLYAGRHEYNGSASAKSGATNYVAPLNTLLLVSYEPVEYSYLITVGSVEQIREIFTANKDFAANESLHKNYQSMRIGDTEVIVSGDTTSIDLKETQSRNLIFPSNNATVVYDATEKALKLTATGDDTGVHVRLESLGGIPTAGKGTLVLEYMIPVTNAGASYQTDVFICAGSYTDAAEACRVRLPLVKDGEYHRLEIPVSDYAYWTGNLNALRFDFFDVAPAGDVMYLRAVELK